MTTTTDEPITDNVIELGIDTRPLIERIDQFLTEDTNRTLIPQDEVRDLCLDLRNMLTQDPA